VVDNNRSGLGDGGPENVELLRLCTRSAVTEEQRHLVYSSLSGSGRQKKPKAQGQTEHQPPIPSMNHFCVSACAPSATAVVFWCSRRERQQQIHLRDQNISGRPRWSLKPFWSHEAKCGVDLHVPTPCAIGEIYLYSSSAPWEAEQIRKDGILACPSFDNGYTLADRCPPTL